MKKYFKHSSQKVAYATRFVPMEVQRGEVRAIDKVSFKKEKDVREYLETVESQNGILGYVRVDVTETFYLEK